MNLTFLTDKLRDFGFNATHAPLTLPVVIHGVPGSGKSSLVRTLLSVPDLTARTLGAPYGDSLLTEGVRQYSATESIRTRHRILDEYQLGGPEIAAHFTILLGDPYQGHYRREPHFIKEQSHRVPRPICGWLRSQGFQITSERPGTCLLGHPYKLPPRHPALSATVLHLGPASANLARSHNLPSHCPRAVQGAEFDEVTLLAHSSELVANRIELYVAATRAASTLTVLSDAFDELRPAA